MFDRRRLAQFLTGRARRGTPLWHQFFLLNVALSVSGLLCHPRWSGAASAPIGSQLVCSTDAQLGRLSAVPDEILWYEYGIKLKKYRGCHAVWVTPYETNENFKGGGAWKKIFREDTRFRFTIKFWAVNVSTACQNSLILLRYVSHNFLWKSDFKCAPKLKVSNSLVN